MNLKERLKPYTTKNLKERLKIYTIKDPQELLDGALGNNAEPVKEYPDWDDACWEFWANMARKYQAERWDR